MEIQTKRVYEPVGREDGIRVLVDRIWPRGMGKAKLKADLWLKEAAPSAALRKWFGHAPERWKGFKKRYFDELAEKPEVVRQLLLLAVEDRLTLLFSARDVRCNQAVALKEYLTSRSGNASGRSTER